MFTPLASVVGVALTFLLCLGVVPVSSVVDAQSVVTPGSVEGAIIAAEIKDGELIAAIVRAVRGARHRLEQHRCADILNKFCDTQGRPLAEVLLSLRLEPVGLLTRVIFRDGRDNAICRASPAAAFTGPGSRVVFVCGQRFPRLSRERAQLVVIHELLHTLGLGERPPTTGEIDRLVARHCGRR
jgi:hypothetical protein